MKVSQAQLNQYCNQVLNEIGQLEHQRAQLRKKEKDLRFKEKAFANYPQVGFGEGPEDLKVSLARLLPPHLVPGNVGDVSTVAWPFYYPPMEFNFGTDPTLTSTTRQTQSFQVTQEAGFLATHLYCNFDDYANSGGLGPYQLEIRDNQSTRQFNDRPIPLQMIGSNSRPSKLVTPFLILPNASINFIVTTWIPDGESLATLGESRFQIAVGGIRVRIDNAKAVLSTVFSK